MSATKGKTEPNLLLMTLKEYRKKRKFSSSPEPIGESSKKKDLILNFVIQKHQASHLHYDLRLESDNVLKSWAIPKGPSLKPNEKRLAMMVEDHPLEYQDFEGVIPKGNYGAGNVIIWDKGNYILRDSRKNFADSLKEGKITFVLNGEKLKGEFALVRIKNNEKAWLLIKKRDGFASAKDITKRNRSVISGLNIEEIGNNSDPKHGKRSVMPRNLKPMLTKLTDKPFRKEGWFFEIKWDGFRALAEIRTSKIKLYSRNNIIFNEKFPAITRQLRSLGIRAILDGEIAVLDKKGRTSFQLMQNYLNGNEGTLIYYIFDILYLSGYDLRNLPLKTRKTILQTVIPGNNNLRISQHIEKEGIAFFKKAKKEGLEGIIAKNSESVYRDGVRSGDWLKIKTSKQQEAVIGGFTKPRGSRKYLGSLILGVYEGKDLVYIGNSGGGFDYKSHKELYNNLKDLVTEKSPFKETPKRDMPAIWVKPKLVCEVKFSEWTEDGRMRHPIYLGIRPDKKPKDVVREKQIKI